MDGVAGKHEHFPALVARLQAVEQLDAAHPRHFEIGENDVHRMTLEQVQGFVSRFRKNRPKSERLDDLLAQAADHLLVIYNQDSDRGLISHRMFVRALTLIRYPPVSRWRNPRPACKGPDAC